MASDGSSGPAVQDVNTSPRTFLEMTAELDELLHGDKIGVFKDVFQKIENDIQIPRLKVVLGFLACLALFLLFSDGAHFICDFICFVYPACVFIWVVEQGHGQINYRKWLTYWVMFNMCNFGEYLFLPTESPASKFYWLGKCMMMILCFRPLPWSGSEHLYLHSIGPFLESYLMVIDNCLASARESADNGVPLFVLLFCACVWGFKFLCNVLGFLYPAYMSMGSLLIGLDVRMHWLTYWVLYSSYNIMDYVLDGLPLYYPVKFVLLGIYLLEPRLQKEISVLVQKLILYHKPMSHANRVIKRFVQMYLASNQVSNVARVNQMEGRSLGTSRVLNFSPKRNKNTAVKVQSPPTVVDPLEIDLQMSSPMVKAVLELNVEVELIKKAITQKLARDGPGQNFTSVGALLEAVFDLSACKAADEVGSSVDELSYQIGVKDLLNIRHSFSSENHNQVPMEVIEENRQLKEQRLCKICMLEEVEMVFVPCGHLVCCHDCSFKLHMCPICRAEIDSSLRAYMS